jgi:hypothetical protein
MFPQDRLFLPLQTRRTKDHEEEVTMNPNSRNPKTTMLTPLPEISLESFYKQVQREDERN